jgi:hypothetical protein
MSTPCKPELVEGQGGWHWYCLFHDVAEFAPQSRESAEAAAATHVTDFTHTSTDDGDTLL